MENVTREEAIEMWRNCDRMQKHYRAEELRLRSLIVANEFPTDDPLAKGSLRSPLSASEDLVVTRKLDYKLKGSIQDIEAVMELFTPTEAALLFTWEPNLSVSNFNNLPDDKKKLIEPVLTIKPALPSLEVKPKSRKG